jgi:hypothetical protein
VTGPCTIDKVARAFILDGIFDLDAVLYALYDGLDEFRPLQRRA